MLDGRGHQLLRLERTKKYGSNEGQNEYKT
jgi:hypothetical protein